jgi:dTDP-4-amino-4,6-dideoxygalactose transaminase
VLSTRFIAAAKCVLYERAGPVFVDIDPLTGNVDPNLIEDACEAVGADPTGFLSVLNSAIVHFQL